MELITPTYIDKAAAILIRDRRVLMCRKHGEEIYITPGGKIEAGETPEQALAREIVEELGISLVRCSLLGHFEGKHNFQANVVVRIQAFLVETDGKPHAQAEIAEIRWVNSKFASEGVLLSQINFASIIPFLLGHDLID